jgi:hypothetical protein
MSYFGFKSQIFLNNFVWGIKLFYVQGPQKKSEGPHFGHVCYIGKSVYTSFRMLTFLVVVNIVFPYSILPYAQKYPSVRYLFLKVDRKTISMNENGILLEQKKKFQ